MEIKNISINMINSRYTDVCVVLADENLSSKHGRFEAFYINVSANVSVEGVVSFKII